MIMTHMKTSLLSWSGGNLRWSVLEYFVCSFILFPFFSFFDWTKVYLFGINKNCGSVEIWTLDFSIPPSNNSQYVILRNCYVAYVECCITTLQLISQCTFLKFSLYNTICYWIQKPIPKTVINPPFWGSSWLCPAYQAPHYTDQTSEITFYHVTFWSILNLSLILMLRS